MKIKPLSLGYTLVELMVTLAVSAILLSVAAPSFDSFITNSQVRSHTRDLVSALAYARSEAIDLGKVIAICGSDDSSNCSASNDWSQGWMIFIDDGVSNFLKNTHDIARVVTGRGTE